VVSLAGGPAGLLGAVPLQDGATSDPAAAAVPEPTCERGPAAVVTTVAEAMGPPEDGASGLAVLWAFTDPDLRENRHYRGFRGFYAGSQFDPLRTAEGIGVGDVVREGSRARITLVASAPAGNTAYQVELREHERAGATCWAIYSIVTA